VGSLRKESFNRKMAKALMKLSPDSLSLEIIEIGGLPLYNQDLDDDPPAAWTEFRERLKKSDGVLFVTPEYNRSVPGVLKNAIDVGSRPYGKNAWAGKPGAVVSVSPALSAVSARITRSGNRWYSLTFLQCRSLRHTSEKPATSLTSAMN